MPIVDLPLNELRAYAGINPKPQDFDAYWEAALQELDMVDPQVELRPAAFRAPGAECFNCFFTGVGGARVHAKVLRPEGAAAKPHPALLLFHGYSGSSGDWWDKLAYVSMGFTVAALDCRGQGGLSEDAGVVRGNTLHGHIIRGLDDAPDKLMYRSLYLDTVQLARVVCDLPGVDAQRLGAMGMSQGGGLTLACAALEPRVRRAVPVCPFLCDFQRVWEMDLAVNAYQELKAFFRNFDPTHAREKEIFTRLGYIDCQHLAPRIRAQVLMAVGLVDEICPPSTQFAAYNKIMSPKDMALYPDFAHESYPGFQDRAFQFLSEL